MPTKSVCVKGTNLAAVFTFAVWPFSPSYRKYTGWSWKLFLSWTLYVLAISHVQLFVTPWTVGFQAPLSTGFSRQEYWSGLSCPSPGDLPNPGSSLGLVHCRWILYCLSQQGSPRILEWVAYPFSRGSCWPRNQTRVSCIAGGLFTNLKISLLL